MLTLRFLATGDSFRSFSYSYRMGVSTVASIVHETCSAIYSVLQPLYMVTPSSPEEWLKIADGFWEKWNTPNTLG
jgi:hypothetical protein